jgi:hypothetical protein
MIAGPAGRCRLHPHKAKIGQVEGIDEGVDGTDRIVLVHPFVQAFGQKRRLTALGPCNEPLHRTAPGIVTRFIPDSAFSRSQGQQRLSADKEV